MAAMRREQSSPDHSSSRRGQQAVLRRWRRAHLEAPGGLTFTPKGTPHAFLVVSETARVLTIQSPGIGHAFYRDASEPTIKGESATLDIARVQVAAKANPRGIEILGPPPFTSAKIG